MKRWAGSRRRKLRPTQYKKDSIHSKIILGLKLLYFFSHRIGVEKALKFLKSEYFLTEWSHSYIVLALTSALLPRFESGRS